MFANRHTAQSYNSLSQDPCTAATYLGAVCNNGLQVPALPASNHYTGPSPGQATTCECSTLTYMLISACGACQNRTWISWQIWSQNCPIIERAYRFPVPLPTTTDVPSWAFMNISTAHATLSQPTSTSDTASSSSASSQTSPFFISTSISTSTSVLSSTTTVSPTSSLSSASPNHAGAIAGGVVGGLTLLVALALVFLWFCVRRKRNAAEPLEPVTVQTLNDTSPKMKTNSTSHNASMSTVPTPYTYVGRFLER
ncbi:hypothetical protein EV368DRAFT_42726 [Lentinula lateritia]|nr:hypothetical protein EV368DRAFT_42726 [Lentinula lateritia]